MIPQEHLEAFKETIKNNVLENIVLGFQNTIKEIEKPKNLYDKNLGFGEAPANMVIDADPLNKRNNKTSIWRYIGRNLLEFFSFRRQAVSAQISPKDPNAEALVLEGLVLGHPDILRRFNIAIKNDELEK